MGSLAIRLYKSESYVLLFILDTKDVIQLIPALLVHKTFFNSKILILSKNQDYFVTPYNIITTSKMEVISYGLAIARFQIQSEFFTIILQQITKFWKLTWLFSSQYSPNRMLYFQLQDCFLLYPISVMVKLQQPNTFRKIWMLRTEVISVGFDLKLDLSRTGTKVPYLRSNPILVSPLPMKYILFSEEAELNHEKALPKVIRRFKFALKTL